MAVKQRLQQELGADAEIRLFGSRLDDEARGGDVDLLVRSPRRLEQKVWLAARLAAAAERVLGGRKVDVLIVDPDTRLEPVHLAALRDGVAL
jgi:predicted nucleotidyltransferase